MNWVTPLATLIGAVVGVGSALLVERFRWTRDREKDRAQQRREVYIEFLMALSQSHSSMRSTVLQAGDDPESRRYLALHEAFDGSGLWRFRQSLSLTAPADIIKLAVDTCDALAAVRDTLVATPDIRSDAYVRAREDLWRTNAELRESMRKDLGMDGPPDPEVARYRELEGRS
ncbi:hypothetical protein [Amycolatopsis kentuckyensis]|uniref:hypothetical protein n=1 Tax=Amycolatopsis kentuckyensis TaxID=218823 RepID=UPI000A38584D|nr:hypothetical protein [Amycolatopsis kentuckyensis]